MWYERLMLQVMLISLLLHMESFISAAELQTRPPTCRPLLDQRACARAN